MDTFPSTVISEEEQNKKPTTTKNAAPLSGFSYPSSTTQDIGLFSGITVKEINSFLNSPTSDIDDSNYTVIMRLANVVQELRIKIEKFETLLQNRVEPFNTYIYGDISEHYYIKEKIPVLIEEEDEIIQATFVELNIFGSGESQFEAIRNLKISLSDYYERLQCKKDQKLGKIAKYTFDILNKYIGEK